MNHEGTKDTKEEEKKRVFYSPLACGEPAL
jgi:hypothetical protein